MQTVCLIKEFRRILKQIEHRMRTGENPPYAIPISLDVINDSKIKNGTYSVKDLGISEDEWRRLLHREKVSKAFMYWKDCNRRWWDDCCYKSLIYFLKPNGEVDCSEIGITSQDLENLRIKKIFMQWATTHKHLFTEIRHVLSMIAERGIYDNMGDVIKDAIKTSDANESMQGAFILLLKEESRKRKI